MRKKRRQRSRREPRQMTLPGMPVSTDGPAAKRRRGPIARARLVLVSTPLTRRRFLSGTLGWVSAAIAAALGIPAAAAVVAPALRREDLGWSPVARLGEPEAGEPDLQVVGTPILASFTSLVEDAYMKAAPRDVAVFVLNHGNGDFTIFDDRCTHLGCPFNWNDQDETFFCPCHNGVFDVDGRVLGGPPPRPLDRYEYRIDNNVLYAGKLYQVDDELKRITT